MSKSRKRKSERSRDAEVATLVIEALKFAERVGGTGTIARMWAQAAPDAVMLITDPDAADILAWLYCPEQVLPPAPTESEWDQMSDAEKSAHAKALREAVTPTLQSFDHNFPRISIMPRALLSRFVPCLLRADDLTEPPDPGMLPCLAILGSGVLVACQINVNQLDDSRPARAIRIGSFGFGKSGSRFGPN